MTKQYLFLSLFVVIGAFLRIYRLDSRPLGFTWDEAALGYNAFSLLTTGRDEHGKALPIIFESFSDYKPGLYIYFTVPSVATLGLTEFATRLPSALFGTLSIVLIFLLAKKMYSRGWTAPAASFVMAINPWSIHFSRGAWEANMTVFLTLVATVLFIKRRLAVSALFFAFTIVAYQGSKMFTPLLLMALLWQGRKTLATPKLVLPAVILFLSLIPVVTGLSTQAGRLKVYSVFSYTRDQDTVRQLLRQDSTNQKNITYYLFHSEPLDQFRGIVQRFLNHFSPLFLFIFGDWSNPRHSDVYQGYFYVPELATMAVGLVFVLRHPSRLSKLLLFWLLLAPIPAALSRDIVSGVRSLPLMVPLVVISGIGLTRMLARPPLALIWIAALTFFLVQYLDLYYIHTPQHTAADWLSTYKPALQIVKENYVNFSRVVISDKLGQPYIFVLFNLQISPRQFQDTASIEKNSQGDVSRVLSFGKFQFRPVFYPADRGLSSTILVGDESELPPPDVESTPNVATYWRTTYPNGTPALSIVSLK